MHFGLACSTATQLRKRAQGSQVCQTVSPVHAAIRRTPQLLHARKRVARNKKDRVLGADEIGIQWAVPIAFRQHTAMRGCYSNLTAALRNPAQAQSSQVAGVAGRYGQGKPGLALLRCVRGSRRALREVSLNDKSRSTLFGLMQWEEVPITPCVFSSTPRAPGLHQEGQEAQEGGKGQRARDEGSKAARVQVEERFAVDQSGPSQHYERAKARPNEPDDVRNLLTCKRHSNACYNDGRDHEAVQNVRVPTLRGNDRKNARSCRRQVDRRSQAHYHSVNTAHQEHDDVVVSVVQNEVLLGESTEREVPS
mmetsp:Transcript_21184/g.49255  ORF Transcript_21184/g.49255 Transcript_21184/m.49255 type:complete len:308 (+) Transcript_21184:21-944(+)